MVAQEFGADIIRPSDLEDALSELRPVFVQGPRFEKAFPEVRIAPVTSDIRSLAPHGFRDEIITAWGQSIPSLNSLQFDAVNEYGILEGKHPLVKGVTRRGNVERAAASALW